MNTPLIHSDVFGIALLDYLKKPNQKSIVTHSTIAGEDAMSLSYLFRDFEEMPLLEKIALQNCYGSVLDLGCGAGNHSLYLQQKGIDVTALDLSPGAIEVCKKRGIKKQHLGEINLFKASKFDSIIALMNGIGYCGKLHDLTRCLTHLKSLLNSHGQILIDSSDLVYMFDDQHEIEKLDHYYGEVEFTMSYQNYISPIFSWLYVDFITLQKYAHQANLHCELLKEGAHFDYLAKLTHQ